MKMNECESSPGSDFSLSLSRALSLARSLSPESGASERSGCKNQSGAMRQAAPQLANHRFEHQKRGGAVHLPATLSKQPSSHAATLLSSSSPPLPAAHGCSRFCAPSAVCAPQLHSNLRQCGFYLTTPSSSSSSVGLLTFFSFSFFKKKQFFLPQSSRLFLDLSPWSSDKRLFNFWWKTRGRATADFKGTVSYSKLFLLKWSLSAVILSHASLLEHLHGFEITFLLRVTLKKGVSLELEEWDTLNELKAILQTFIFQIT